MEIDADNLSATELRLGLPGSSSSNDRPKKPSSSVGAKRALETDTTKSEASGTGPAAGDDTTTPAKAQVVGWPPVRAYRKNTFQAAAAAKKAEQQQPGGLGLYVKVSMDGAPYLRKVDLRMYKGYRELKEALDALFTRSSSGAGALAADCRGDQYAVAYEDKDGDLMLVGDVPWDMFISSCKKLRIMKGSEAR
ncbi:auxin-responsive protein IAA24-like [Phragmites australis]|uniref:auxin-responsive protein IAA24-like n=1 Tax=Phragmites australis TaxID=29695 RepID=UPI002D79BAF3|nr:auxin-responsive protein IAA24-like [Phragmites australis]